MTRWRVVAVGAAAILAIVAGLFAMRAPSPAPSDIGGPFRLVTQTGAPADQRLLLGKWSAVFFGYTFCPDVCPTTLANLGQAVAGLGDKAGRFQVVFITVDPARDTPSALKSYLSSATFPRATIGLTGDAGQIAAVARAYHVYYQRVPQGDTYTMDHSAIVYLMDPRGRFVAPLDVSAPPAGVAGQILAAMDGQHVG